VLQLKKVLAQEKEMQLQKKLLVPEGENAKLLLFFDLHLIRSTNSSVKLFTFS
jgi:hypothetical protein